MVQGIAQAARVDEDRKGRQIEPIGEPVLQRLQDRCREVCATADGLGNDNVWICGLDQGIGSPDQIVELTTKTASCDLAHGPSCLLQNASVHQLGSLVIGDQSNSMGLLGEALCCLPERVVFPVPRKPPTKISFVLFIGANLFSAIRNRSRVLRCIQDSRNRCATPELKSRTDPPPW